MCSARAAVSGKFTRGQKVIVVLDKLEFADRTGSTVECRDCTRRFRREYEKGQARIWANLPRVFRLARGWEELLAGNLED